MRSVRELIGPAVRATDLRPGHGERAIDHIGALASAPEFGAMLLRLRYGLDSRAYTPAKARLLARSTRLRAEHMGIHARLCARVLDEWLVDVCERCHGRTFVQRGHARGPCRQCSGTGRRVPRDADRAAALGLPLDIYLKRWARRLERLLAYAQAAEGEGARRLQIELERFTVRAQQPTISRPPQSVATRPVDVRVRETTPERLDAPARPGETEPRRAP